MNYKECGDNFIIKIEKGEKSVDTLKSFLLEKGIKSAWFTAIGAASEVDLAFYDSVNKEYVSKVFEGDFEITSLIGNVSTMEDKVVIHSHITLSNTEYNTFGGHLNEVTISGTLEIMLHPLEVDLKRKKDEETQLNLLDF